MSGTVRLKLFQEFRLTRLKENYQEIFALRIKRYLEDSSLFLVGYDFTSSHQRSTKTPITEVIYYMANCECSSLIPK